MFKKQKKSLTKIVMVKTVKCLKEFKCDQKGQNKEFNLCTKKTKTLWLMQIWYFFLKQLVFGERFSLGKEL